MKKVIIFTDGACRGNPGPGGWGVLLRYAHHQKTYSGAEQDTTNNRMELTAAIKALSLLRERCDVELHTDSQYVQKGITEWLPVWKKKNWKRADNKPVKNIDLWQALAAETEKHHVKWRWVKGHSGHADNELVDALAVNAIDKLLEK